MWAVEKVEPRVQSWVDLSAGLLVVMMADRWVAWTVA